MKTFKKGFVLLFVSVIIAQIGFAQTKSLAQKADDLFNQNRYLDALEAYE